MALKKLLFKPGIYRDNTNYANEGGWYDMDKVRFRSGFAEKIGGWQVVNFTPYAGQCRSLYNYQTTDGATITGLGTSEKYYVLVGTALYDITPVRVVYTTSTTPSTDNCFDTTDTSTTVTVTLTGHGANEGDYVTFAGAAAVGGVPDTELNTEHQIFNVTATTFDITVTTAATSTANGGGTSITATFQIHIGYGGNTYGYGWGTGVWSRLTWGSASTNPILLPPRIIFQDQFNNDLIWNIQDGDIYYWDYDSAFSNISVGLNTLSGSRAVPEQVGKSMFASSGHLLALSCTEYGRATTAGAVISSITNSGTTATITTATAHGLDPLDWVEFSGQTPRAYQGEYQVVTTPTSTTFTVVLLQDPGGSASVEGTYVYIDYSGNYDPLLIRWANVNPDIGPQPEEWKPEITNSAGFIRVKGGSFIVTGFNTRQETLIFTNTALNSLQFLGTSEVFSVQQISDNINIAGSNVVAEANNVVLWMGHDKFYFYDGRVNTLPCSIRQYIFTDINIEQSSLFFAGTNREFNEIIWFYCSAASTTIDRYVIYNYEEQLWYYGTLNRTAWFDSQVVTSPLAASNGYIYEHEVGNDDGQPTGQAPLPISAYIQSSDMAIEDGDNFILTKRVIPDVNFTNSDTNNSVTGVALTPEVEMTVGVRNFPGAANNTDNVAGNTLSREVITTASINEYTNQVFVRARGRQMNFKIESNTVGVRWQIGAVRIDYRPDGRRG
jgi:hypothetical protein